MGRPRSHAVFSGPSENDLAAAGFAVPRTQGIPLPHADVDEQAWLGARRGGIGASELGSVLGVPGAYGSPFSVWWSKTLGWESERSEVMKIGSMLEQTIGTLFAERRPDLFVARPAHRLWMHHSIAWMLCSPDFVACDADGNLYPVECKSDDGPSWGPQPYGDDRIPARHLVQIRVQCHVLGARSGFLVRMAGKKLSVYEVHGPDAVEVGAWIMHGNLFMASIETGVSPDPDGHKETTAALQRLYPAPQEDPDKPERATVSVSRELADEWRAARLLKEKAERDWALAQNRMRDALQRARYAEDPDGNRLAERQVYKRSDYHVAAGTVDRLLFKADR